MSWFLIQESWNEIKQEKFIWNPAVVDSLMSSDIKFLYKMWATDVTGHGGGGRIMEGNLNIELSQEGKLGSSLSCYQ